MGQRCGCATGEDLGEISKKRSNSGLYIEGSEEGFFTAPPNWKKDLDNVEITDEVTKGKYEEEALDPSNVDPMLMKVVSVASSQPPGSTGDTVTPSLAQRPGPAKAQVVPLLPSQHEQLPEPPAPQLAPSLPLPAEAIPCCTPRWDGGTALHKSHSHSCTKPRAGAAAEFALAKPAVEAEAMPQASTQPMAEAPPGPEALPQASPQSMAEAPGPEAEALPQASLQPVAEAPPDPEAVPQPTPQAMAESPPDEEAMKVEQLSGMGFESNQASAALNASGGNVEQALAMLLSGAIPEEESSHPDPGNSPGVDPLKLDQLTSMGFTRDQAMQALVDSGGDVEQATMILLSAA